MSPAWTSSLLKPRIWQGNLVASLGVFFCQFSSKLIRYVYKLWRWDCLFSGTIISELKSLKLISAFATEYSSPPNNSVHSHDQIVYHWQGGTNYIALSSSLQWHLEAMPLTEAPLALLSLGIQPRLIDKLPHLIFCRWWRRKRHRVIIDSQGNFQRSEKWDGRELQPWEVFDLIGGTSTGG